MTYNDEIDRWAQRIAGKVHRGLPSCFDLDDLIQEARIAAWQCCERFDEGRGVAFFGFAHAYVRGACLMSVRGRAYREKVQHEEVQDVIAIPDPALEAVEFAHVEIAERERKQIAAARLRHSLPLRRRILDGQTFTDTAAAMGLTPQEASRRYRRALAKLRRELVEA